jgi:hypothetical protein
MKTRLFDDAALAWRELLGRPIDLPLARKVAIAVYLMFVATACLWVPWTQQFHDLGDDGKHLVVQLPGTTYAPLWWSPPKPKEDKDGKALSWTTARIDLTRVVLELLAMSAALGVFFVLSRPTKQP